MSKSEKFNRILKVFSWSFLSLILFVTLLLLIALSSIGTRWAIDYVNQSDFGLTLNYNSGSFYSQLNLDSIIFAQEGLDAKLEELSLDIGLSCLFAAEVCINRVHIEKLYVNLGDMPETVESTEITKNKLIKLPILFSLNELSISHLSIKQNNFEVVTAEKFALSLSFLEKIDITNLSLASLTVNLPKAIEMSEAEQLVSQKANDLPRTWLKALAKFKYEAITIPKVFIPIDLTLNNSNLSNICIRQQLKDDSLQPVFCNNNIASSLSIKNQKLASTFIFQNLHQPNPIPNFAPSSLKLEASIDFAEKFEHTLTLQALKIDTPIFNELNADMLKMLKIDTPIFDASNGFKLKAEGNINKFSLSMIHQATQQNLLNLNLSMQISKSELPLTFNASFQQLPPEAVVDLQNWLPQVQKETFKQLKGVSILSTKISGDMQGYRITADTKTASISGIQNVELSAIVRPQSLKQGSRELIVLDKLNVSGDIGSIAYSGKALLEGIEHEQTQLSWKGSLALDSLQLAHINESLDSMISGLIPHEFVMNETSQSGRIENALLSGNWQNLPLLVEADLELEKNGNVKVETVSLNQGTNNILIKGNLYSNQAIESLSQLGANFTINQDPAVNASSLDFSIDLNSLSELYPDLKGEVKAQGQISGLVQSPKIVMQANINDLITGTTRLQNAFIDLSVDMENKLMSKAEVKVVDLFFGEQTIPHLTFELSGDESEQFLLLKVPEGQYLTEHLIKGKLNADRSAWSGQWLRGLIETNLVELELQEQAKLAISFQPFSLYLGKHCWAGRGDKLCLSDVNATQQSASTKLSIDYNVMNLGMVELLPSIDVAASDLDLAVDVEVNWQPQTGVSFLADIAALNSTLVANENRVTVENIIAQIKGTPTNISSSFAFDSKEAGQVSINSQLDLGSQPYQHKGSLRISEFAVSYFAPFVTAVKRLNGDINADVTFDGPINKPSLQGELTLVDGAFVLKEYPLRLTKYNQNLVFEGSKADFSATFMLGDGKGSLDGDIDFSNELIVNTKLLGDKLDIEYETYQFKISPDIQLSLQPDLIKLTGSVELPFARIKIKSLPASAKSPSQDIIVIDEKQVAKQNQLPLDMNLSLLIDKNKKGEVKLDALDLKAELSGDLNVKIKQNTTTLNGIVQVLKGDYAAYGQVLQIRKGDITFSGQPDVPAFDIEAIRNPLNTKDNVIAGIRVTGNAIKPKVDLFSEPPMDQAQQLSYLISGANSFGAGEESDSNTTLVNALLSFGLGRSENGIGSLGKKLGVKDLNIQTAGQGDNTQMQLSGRLAEGVKITYGIGVFDSVSEVSVHYQLLPQLYLEAVSGVNSTLDLYYQITSND